jgi:hypothetical protein
VLALAGVTVDQFQQVVCAKADFVALVRSASDVHDSFVHVEIGLRELLAGECDTEAVLPEKRLPLDVLRLVGLNGWKQRRAHEFIRNATLWVAPQRKLIHLRALGTVERLLQAVEGFAKRISRHGIGIP